MTDKHYSRLLREVTPRLNPDIANGLATKHVPYVDKMVDDIFRTAAAGFPEGLKYEGFARCTPREWFKEITKRVNSQRTWETARTSAHLNKYMFSYMGQLLDPRFIFLPNVMDGGLMYLRGSLFAVAPVLADRVFSINATSIFIPLQGAKLTFERMYYTFMRDGIQVDAHLIHASLYNHTAEGKAELARQPIRGDSTMAHYLFCRYGVEETFKRYGGTDIIVGDSATINEEAYPAKDWVIFTSAQIKPQGVRLKIGHPVTDIRMAIPRENYSDAVHILVGSFFYAIDHFPERFPLEFALDITRWQLALGIFLFGEGQSEGKILERLDDHLASLDTYMDRNSRKKLLEDGVIVETVYDLFFHMIDTFHSRLTGNAKDIASMYGKQFVILRYIVFDINKAIYNFSFNLRNSKKPILNPKEINAELRRNLRTDLIFQLNQPTHNQVTSVTCPGDNKVFKITARLVAQTSTTGGRGGNKGSMSDPARQLHSSMAEVGSFRNMSKSDPTGRDRANVYVRLSHDGLVERSPALRPILDDVQQRIQRR